MGTLVNKIDSVKNLIFANSSLPTVAKSAFYTVFDNQRRVCISIYESDFNNPDTDVIVDPKYCTLLEKKDLIINKYWPEWSPFDVTLTVSEEGILSVHVQMEEDTLDYTLKINGVKSGDELAKSMDCISKAIIG